MAKKFNDIFIEAKEQVYSAPAQSLVVLASANSMVEFTPVLAPNGKADGTTSQYTIQRRKRPSVNTVANVNAGTTASALAALDQFTKTDWTSLGVATGALKSVGFKSTFNDDYDFSLNPQHSRDMLYQVGEIAEQRKADLIALMETFTATGAALPAYAKGETHQWDAIADEVIKLARVADEYKAKQSKTDFVVVVSADVAKNLSKEMGTVFNQEAPIAQTGFKTGMSINGTPVIVDEALEDGKVYIFHKEALAFKAADVEKEVSIDLGLVEFTGRFFYEIMVVADTARAVKIAAA